MIALCRRRLLMSKLIRAKDDWCMHTMQWMRVPTQERTRADKEVCMRTRERTHSSRFTHAQGECMCRGACMMRAAWFVAQALGCIFCGAPICFLQLKILISILVRIQSLLHHLQIDL